MKHPFAIVAAALLAGAFALPSARAADADVTGLVPTIWWDFETQPAADGLTAANKGSASITFTSEGTKTYSAGAIGGTYAIDTSKFTPYSGAGSFSTAGGAYTVSLVMNLGTTENGITLNLRNETGERDLIVRRGSTAGSLVVGCDTLMVATRHNLTATFEDDSTYHLVSVVVEDTGISLYVDGTFVDSTTDFTPWTDTGRASRLQFGSHLGGVPSGEAKYGGCIDDLRIHDAALTPAQMKAIAAEYGLASLEGYIAVAPSGEPTVGTGSFRAPFVLLLSEGDVAEAAIVYGTDAALSAPTTNVVGSALSAGAYAASLSGLASGTTYWWKLVASNGVAWAETDVASFRTLDVIVATDYLKRIPIVVSGYAGSSALTNFPILVKLAAGQPFGFDYADCAADGADIRFAAADGLVLPHEIESWNTNGTSYVWVRVPCIAGTTTQISLYYGADPSGLPVVTASDVWSRYAAVFHGGTAIVDAKGVATVTADSVSSATTGGKAGGVMSKGSANGFKFSNPVTSGALTSIGNFSFSGWFKKSGGTTSVVLSNKGRQEWSYDGFLALVQPSDNGDYFSVGVGVNNSGAHQPTSSNGKGNLVIGEWGHLAFGYDKSATQLDSYFNGTNIFSTAEARNILDPGKTVWSFGGFQDSSDNCFQGDMDELRILNGTASADWIRAECASVADPAAFAALSPAEATDADQPRLGNLSASDENGVATFSVAISVPGYGGAVPTAVSVFYGTDGETWTELFLGSTNGTATLTGSVSGLTAGVRYLWYAVATATIGGTPKTTTSQQQSFVARAFDPTGNYKSFTATIVWNGAPAENVPFLIRISEDGVNGFDYDDVTASRFEILDAGGQLLPYEIDTWNTNGESLVWTRLPIYENGATVTVRYGAPFANAPLPASDVWTGYAGVWHLGEANGDAQDSTGNGLVAAASGANAEEDSVGLACKIGKGRQMATAKGRKSFLSVADDNLLDCGDSLTFSGWFKASGTYDDYSMRYVSRKNAYNSQNGWEAEAQFGGADTSAKTVSARGASDGDHKTTVPDVRNDWLHLVLVYNGTTLTSYVNGVPQTSLTLKAACSDNDLALSFGNNAVGNESNWCGWMDELRFLSDPVSPEYAVAEYHAMADDGAISFSSVSSSDTSAPVLGTPSVARNADGSFTVSVEVSENAPASIVCTVGGADCGMTPADSSLPATYSATVSGLVPGTYVASVRATATSGTAVSATGPDAFHAGALAIAKISDADEGMLTPGIFRVSRADADSTDLPALTFDVAFSGPGLATIVDPGISTATIPAGAAYVDIAVTPVATDAVDEDAGIVLTVSGTNIGQPSTGMLTVVDAGFDLAVRYVSTTGNDANSGGTPETAKRTIAAAVAAVNPVAPSRPCTVHVAPGLYPISSPLVVTNAISVIGDDPDPSRTVVSNADRHGDWGVTRRVFTINHADAFVANLTMQSGYMLGSDSGGNFSVGSAGGTVSNCVIEAGDTRGNTYAAGGRLSGGLVTHTIFRKNICDSGMGNWQGQHGGVLELYGSSRAENCLLVDNPPSGTVYLSLIGDSAVMRNCTIADTGLKSTNEYCKVFTALRINSANATVLNTVIAGVTNTIDGAACPPTGSVEKFQNGAFDGDVSSLPAGTVTGTAAAFFPHYAENVPYATKYRPKSGGPLYDKGANYDGMALYDLSGTQKRKVGSHVDIGCYEANGAGTMLLIR